jgi:hypothetical protein
MCVVGIRDYTKHMNVVTGYAMKVRIVCTYVV